jgi:hypothetical protein
MKPFNVGDIVDCTDPSFKGLNIILEVERCQGRWQYVSQKGAWLDHKSLKLIEPSNEINNNAERAGQLIELLDEYESYDSKRLLRKINKLEEEMINSGQLSKTRK